MKIETIEQLRKLYGEPAGRVTQKQMEALDKHARHFIEKSPFLIMSTVGKSGRLDASPRGGAAGFVHIANNKQIVIPDSKGNKLVDSLSNIVETGQVGLLFLLPGVDEALRVNGKAEISTNPELLAHFSTTKNLAPACILVTIEEAFLHCAKALMRSKLWSQEIQIERSEFPSMGQMIKDQIGSSEKPETHEEMVERYKEML